MSEPAPTPEGIDPRGPRFAAVITSALLLLTFVLGLLGTSTADAPLSVGFALLLVSALLFLWGVLAPRTAPWGVLFRLLVRPRLAPPTDWEDPRPPRFAQGVGLAVTGLGVLLALAGLAWAVPVAAGVAFSAAFLNAAFDVCLGCRLYVLLGRTGVLGSGTR